MLYMVECGFREASREADWNEYYSGRKLDEVLAVPGFRTSQRFRAVAGGRAPYLAMHTVASSKVLSGNNYKAGGGGNFADWQGYIIDWSRNLFDGCDEAPAVELHERLAVSDAAPETLVDTPLSLIQLRCVGLDESVSHRAIAKTTATAFAALPPGVQRLFKLYAPLMARRREPAGKAQAIA